ncbi:MAG: rRNA ((1402)-N(4))-methyltransferase [Bacteroidota bacterium]|jgi:phospholipid N-methyltransferase
MIRTRAAFLKAFFKKGNRNGSLTPSSIFLCRKMISTINFMTAECIVELGPGEGVITREIIKRIRPKTQLFLFEPNEDFVDKFLQFEDPRIHVIADSAEFLGKYLHMHGVEKVDYIISSLPLTLFPEDLRENILEESRKVLSSNGVFMQYQYIITALELLRTKFKKVKVGFVPLNIPPAFVYTCQN